MLNNARGNVEINALAPFPIGNVAPTARALPLAASPSLRKTPQAGPGLHGPALPSRRDHQSDDAWGRGANAGKA
eukprot:9481834-Pyramimonas_sp.AAC.1